MNQFGAQLEIGEADTAGDLAMDAFGSALGGMLLVGWAKRSWGTRRRVSARELWDGTGERERNR